MLQRVVVARTDVLKEPSKEILTVRSVRLYPVKPKVVPTSPILISLMM
jgi:hypothetical protein